MHLLNELLYYFTAPFRLLVSQPTKLFSAPRRLLGLSLPARVALLSFLLLVLCAAIAFVGQKYRPGSVGWFDYFVGPFGLLWLGAMLLFPLAVYFTVRAWLESEPSRYPDIDEAWRSGLAALKQKGLDVSDMPLFLVLGAPDEPTAQSLMAATGRSFLVQHVPEGHRPLHWYADEKGVFIVARETCQLSRLNSLAAGRPRAVSPAPDPRRTGAPAGGSRDTIAPGGGGSVLGTISPGAVPEEPSDFGGGGGVFGTLVPGAVPDAGRGPAGAGRAVSAAAVALSPTERDAQTERLRHLCDLLTRIRRPVCPLNGILTLLPFRTVSDVLVAKEMPLAVESDLQTIRQTTKLNCPVTALVTGMESEEGFFELVRRVGTDKAKTNRFGKGFNVWNPPLGERLFAFTAHACGAFEDWVYSLFREPGGLTKAGNAKLYTLLCRIRGEVLGRLRKILEAFSYDPDAKAADNHPLLFGGCYFAATGPTDVQQAFVRNVFDRMHDLEGELEWNAAAWDQDDRYVMGARILQGLSGLLLVGAVAVAVWWYLHLKP